MHNQFLPALLLDYHVEGWRRFAFQDTLLCVTPASLFVSEGNGLDTTYQVGECWVHQQITERVAVSGRHELHTAFCNGACSGGFQFGTYLIDNDDLGHVVLYRLDHHRVLFDSARHLHAACPADTGVRNISITCDFVRGIHYDYTFICFVREDASYFTQQGGFAHTWATENQD